MQYEHACIRFEVASVSREPREVSLYGELTEFHITHEVVLYHIKLKKMQNKIQDDPRLLQVAG